MYNFFPLSKKKKKKKKSFLVQVTYKKVDIEKEDERKREIFLITPDSFQTTHISIAPIPSITNLLNPVTAVKILIWPRVQRHKPSISGSKGKGFTATTS